MSPLGIEPLRPAFLLRDYFANLYWTYAIAATAGPARMKGPRYCYQDDMTSSSAIVSSTDFPLPERLLSFSVEEILPQLSDKLRAWPRTPEMVRYALHLIGAHADKATGLATVNARAFCRVAGRRYGHAILNELRALGYIASDGKYVPGVSSKRYRLTARAKALPLGLIDASPSVSRRIREMRDEKNADTLARAPGAKVIFDDLARFSFPGDCELNHVLAELRAERPHAAPYHQFVVDQFTRRHFFIASSSTGRIFHNLANMPKRIRPFLHVDGEPCAEVDIAACQATLMLSFYPSGCRERDAYAEVIRTDLYQYLAHEIERSTGKIVTRDRVKERWLTQVFGLDKHRKEVWAILARDFPILCQTLDSIRSDDYRKVAFRLQRMEAELVIGKIVPRLKADCGDVGLSTVHDSLICARRIAQQVAVVMRDTLHAALGVEALVRIK